MEMLIVYRVGWNGGIPVYVKACRFWHNTRYWGLPLGWYVAGEHESVDLGIELRTELVEGHPLYGKSLTVIAHCCGGTDDILVIEDGVPDVFNVVHLTNNSVPEILPCPTLDFTGSFDEFRKCGL